MTIEEKILRIRDIFRQLEFSSHSWNNNVISVKEYNDRKENYLEAILAMREKSNVSREQIEGCLNSVFSDYALNGQGNRSLIKSLTEELLELINGKEA